MRAPACRGKEVCSAVPFALVIISFLHAFARTDAAQTVTSAGADAAEIAQSDADKENESPPLKRSGSEDDVGEKGMRVCCFLPRPVNAPIALARCFPVQVAAACCRRYLCETQTDLGARPRRKTAPRRRGPESETGPAPPCAVGQRRG